MPTIICWVADISAPDSSNTLTGAVLEDDVIWIVIVGAGSTLSPVMLYNCSYVITLGRLLTNGIGCRLRTVTG